jgi:hypothetical protein
MTNLLKLIERSRRIDGIVLNDDKKIVKTSDRRSILASKVSLRKLPICCWRRKIMRKTVKVKRN